MKKGKRILSMVLSVTMAGMLSMGCEKGNEMLEQTAKKYMNINATISKNSKWVNSDLAGVVTKDTTVSEKDDFATAVNKDWILSVEDQVKKEGNVSTLAANAETVTKQKKELLDIAIDGGNFAENKVGMDAAQYEHMSDVFATAVSTAADWDARNKAGVKPLKTYISAIDSIKSLDQMTAYLCDTDGKFLSKLYLVPFGVGESMNKKSKKNVVMMNSLFDNSMDAGDENMSDGLHQEYVMETVTSILKKLGYSSSEAAKTVKKCWQIETELSEHTAYKEIMDHISSEDDIRKQFNNVYTKKELSDLAGAYPLMEILKTYHYDQSDEYVVYEPDYVKSVAKLYKEKNLEKIKSYYIVHTVLLALPLLTRDDYNQYEAYFTDTSKADSGDETDTTEKNTSDTLSKEDEILQSFVRDYMNEMFEEMYITNYCSAEQKAYIQNMIQETVTEYEKILSEEEWMSDATKQKAIEKLNCITTRVLYPDNMADFDSLQIEGGNLLDIVERLRTYDIRKDADWINKQTNKMEWNLKAMPTTTVNAYYSAQDNSVTILAGIIADKQFLNTEASDEENMAHLGYVIGHEISHAFDTSGYLYDKDGNEKKWWTDQDETAFQKRVAKLSKYYSSFKYLRDAAQNINGKQIQGEAIADMGGLKCMIRIGKQKENFDYQKFFRAFAYTWATSRKFTVETQMNAEDSHPLPFLRTNVTVQQFEEFYEAFDIQPTDGMYLAPEKRVAVW